MTLGENALRRCFVGVIAALTFSVGVWVPALEAGEVDSGPVLESEHAPGECPKAHDHTLCTQVGSNHAFPVKTTARQDPHTILPVGHSTLDTDAPLATLTEGNAPRAPPEA